MRHGRSRPGVRDRQGLGLLRVVRRALPDGRFRGRRAGVRREPLSGGLRPPELGGFDRRDSRRRGRVDPHLLRRAVLRLPRGAHLLLLVSRGGQGSARPCAVLSRGRDRDRRWDRLRQAGPGSRLRGRGLDLLGRSLGSQPLRRRMARRGIGSHFGGLRRNQLSVHNRGSEPWRRGGFQHHDHNDIAGARVDYDHQCRPDDDRLRSLRRLPRGTASF